MNLMRDKWPVGLLVALAAFVVSMACQQADEGDQEYAESMAREHEGDTPVPGAASEAAQDREVATEEVTYGTVDGNPVTGYLARPANLEGSAPGILVIHEWWGLNDNIRSMAEELAGEGYIALAVDLYAGETAENAEGARALMESVMKDSASAQENLRQAYAYLESEQQAPQIGTIGWCFGGGWSLQTALLFPEQVDAAVIYYGRLVTDPDELGKLQMPILGIFGSEDEGIPVESVQEFEQALNELGKDASIHIYEGADHAFANPSGERYEPEAAADAWEKTLAFFEEHLKQTS